MGPGMMGSGPKPPMPMGGPGGNPAGGPPPMPPAPSPMGPVAGPAGAPAHIPIPAPVGQHGHSGHPQDVQLILAAAKQSPVVAAIARILGIM